MVGPKATAAGATTGVTTDVTTGVTIGVTTGVTTGATKLKAGAATTGVMIGAAATTGVAA